jgi:hypothetical protein
LRHEWFDDYQEFISFNNDVLEWKQSCDESFRM